MSAALASRAAVRPVISKVRESEKGGFTTSVRGGRARNRTRFSFLFFFASAAAAFSLSFLLLLYPPRAATLRPSLAPPPRVCESMTLTHRRSRGDKVTRGPIGGGEGGRKPRFRPWVELRDQQPHGCSLSILPSTRQPRSPPALFGTAPTLGTRRAPARARCSRRKRESWGAGVGLGARKARGSEKQKALILSPISFFFFP